jgi:signal transduction histidine kinase
VETDRFAFTVDTHLFRELGELLVGRDSTALVELIKNAYDADATRVTVRGDDLMNGNGVITVADDGVGMTPEIFNSAFLRVASRFKEQGNRRSPRFQRRYTGAKGVGRLSAHKLARCLRVTSVPDSRGLGSAKVADLEGVESVIDWRSVEDDHSTLDDVGDSLRVIPFKVSPSASPGTELRLEGLRTKWTKRSLSQFVREVSGCLPSQHLLDPPPFSDGGTARLLEEIRPWTRSELDPGFSISLQGDLDTGDELWVQLFERSKWLLEIDAKPEGVVFGIYPTPATMEDYPDAHNYVLRRDHPNPSSGPFFSARIYAREGQLSKRSADLSRFADETSGIRVYLEGFRVVPYGERHDDWLGLNQDYARRAREFNILLDENSSAALPKQKNETFRTLGNFQYIGGVFLTAEGAAALRPVVNREGFLQDEAFNVLRQLVRNGVDILTRARVATASSGRSAKSEALHDLVVQSPPVEPATEKVESSSPGESHGSESSPSPRKNLDISLTRVRQELTELRVNIGADPSLVEKVEMASAAVDLAEHSVEQEYADQAMLEVLASVGLQFAAFIHEVNGLLSEAQSARTLADGLSLQALPQDQRGILRDLRSGLNSLVQTLTRQTSYLTEVVGPDARRRRKRIPLDEVALTSMQLLANTISERSIEVFQELDESVRTPPMFPAELTIICTNLLTNAVKAAGRSGRILIRGQGISEGGVRIHVENTGASVLLEESERWFLPFETTTTDVDIVLGQGMGLGLPITRRIISEYSGSIKFVQPSPGFATAVEVVIPGRGAGR